jgi:hypothetical protein
MLKPAPRCCAGSFPCSGSYHADNARSPRMWGAAFSGSASGIELGLEHWFREHIRIRAASCFSFNAVTRFSSVTSSPLRPRRPVISQQRGVAHGVAPCQQPEIAER